MACALVAGLRVAGTWFDGRLQRTERYSLYGIPFLKQRLQRLVRFKDTADLAAATLPYVDNQALLVDVGPCYESSPAGLCHVLD